MWTHSWDRGLGHSPVTRTLLIVTAALYLLQMLSHAALRFPLETVFGLSVSGMMSGQVWQILTYQFLHGGPLHLILNMLMLYVLGNEVERAIGGRHFLALYLLSGALGGVGWLLLTYPYEGVCVGASAAIFGVLSAFAVLFPRQEITLLVFFVLPITLRAWILAAILGFIQLVFTISPGIGGIAYAAHLAGGVAGLVYSLVLFRPELWRRRAGARPATERTVESGEIDRLLDKIARDGIQSLSDRERQTLERASRRSGGPRV